MALDIVNDSCVSLLKPTLKGITNGSQNRKRKTYCQHRAAGTDPECIGENAGSRYHAWQYGNAMYDRRNECRYRSECVYKKMTELLLSSTPLRNLLCVSFVFARN